MNLLKKYFWIIVPVILLLIFLEGRNEDTSTETFHSHKEGIHHEIHEKVKSKKKNIKNSLSKRISSGQFDLLYDSKTSVEEKVRLLKIVDFSKQKEETVETFVEFILSENPYDLDADPHSSKALMGQREGAVRVFALKRLFENLTIEELTVIVQEVESNSSDSSLKRVAQQALKAKINGENYFENMIKGIEQLSMPD